MTVLIYSSSPEKAILGTMRVRRLVRSNIPEIWRDYSQRIGISQAELTEYLDGARECSVLELDTPDVWSHSVELDELRRQLHIEPAQSFRYLNGKQLVRLRDLANKDANGPSVAEDALVSALM